MPLYEYKCQKCGATFEKLQRFSDAPLTTHEDCGGDVERLISPPAFQFKGSGWYITDYARKNGSNGSSSQKKADSGATPSSTPAKPESTPASKSDPKP